MSHAGSVVQYRRGCRCVLCREANAAQMRTYRCSLRRDEPPPPRERIRCTACER